MPNVQLIVRWVARPGRETELRDVLRGMLVPTHAEPGEKVYDLYESADGRQFWFIEDWPSEAAFEFHKQSPHLKALGTKTADLIEQAAEVTIVTPVRP